MEHMPSIKYVSYAIVTSLLIFSCPDTRSSDDIAEDVSAEDMSLHQDYDADAMPAYYDPR